MKFEMHRAVLLGFVGSFMGGGLVGGFGGGYAKVLVTAAAIV